MGLFDRLFPKSEKAKIIKVKNSFESFTAYQPTFTSWNGALYESELVRSAIDAKARHMSKLEVELKGAAQPRLKSKVQHKPNEFQTWSQFLYRVATILEMQNTCFILPLTNRYGEMTGYYPALPSCCKVVEYDGEVWLRYQFSTGKVGAIEFKRCGILTKFQYKDDFFGESNRALAPTMRLIDMQNQGIEEGIKSAATFRFYARLTNFKSPEDLAEEQKNFSKKNFASDAGQVLLFPNTYDGINQVDSKPFTVDADTMKLIQTNVYNYFGVNEKILQNSALGDELDAFYEGCIEPFAVQLSEVLTKMTFTDNEQSYGSQVYVRADRLQYMRTSEKIQFVRELGDRGFITMNEGRKLFNYPPLDDGDKAPIRGEYYFVGEKDTNNEEDEDGSKD